jgi:hypothetical protein
MPRCALEEQGAGEAHRPPPPGALCFLWDFLGWTGSKRPVALGLIGPLHEREFATYRQSAERMCLQFDSRFPFANL